MTRLHEVAAGLLVATSRTDSLNSVVILGQNGDVLLVDPGWQQDELDDLADELSARSLKPVVGLATHAHHDHLFWHPDFGDVPRWASPDTVRIAGSHRDELLAALGDGYRAEVLALTGRVSALPGLDIPWLGPEADVLLHNAHIVGHSAVWIAELGVLVAGDMLSDVELPLPDDSSNALSEYRIGLEMLAPYASVARFVIPGHGSLTTDGAARIDADRRYLDDLIAGRGSTDARIGNPGMAKIHAENLALA
ncbi:MAG TPA: MBL fold metallo-hydrolase [Galbitalea sp.]|nr:MBL fold metallo-hydrolase [Galbitalea sp.]